MTILVAVASKHGSTRAIAESIAEQLRSANLPVDLRAAGEVNDLSGYDAVILGSAVYAGSWLPEARKFAARFHAKLAQVPVWVFSSGPVGADNPQPRDDPQQLAAPLGMVPVRDHRVFAGKLELDDLGFGERLIAKVVSAPEGDFRDWDAISRWAREIATALQAPHDVTA
ncbi:MAG TPA: flavodoxin domain-containing protein [Roseiflexaceae bacterium]|jgi:menaquinone-dependent protoporphyrinogen oxidase|nr:flavodoxin domain-containing protein [Roseiflexaceae bacterium]